MVYCQSDSAGANRDRVCFVAACSPVSTCRRAAGLSPAANSDERCGTGKTTALGQPNGWSGDSARRPRVAIPLFRFNDHVVQRTYRHRHNDRECLFTLVYCPRNVDFRAELVSNLFEHLGFRGSIREGTKF